MKWHVWLLTARDSLRLLDSPSGRCSFSNSCPTTQQPSHLLLPPPPPNKVKEEEDKQKFLDVQGPLRKEDRAVSSLCGPRSTIHDPRSTFQRSESSQRPSLSDPASICSANNTSSGAVGRNWHP
ncbi:hypothetical protein CLAIMM_07581 [Cladophialophora immunda]|nr:hypothetical protein CLAIMM_07581 [Cladophialophora immunda]